MESMSPIPACESLTVAFLRECPSDNACLLQTLVALANTAGGDLYLGVDNDGTVIGLTDPSAVEALLIAAVRDRISPSLVGSFAAVPMTVSGKAILRVHIDAGPMKPYSLDPPSASGIYVREGCTNRLASLANITRLVRANNPVSHEDRAAVNQDLTFDACTAFCHERHRAINVKNATIGFWNNRWQAFTNLAFLCSDQSTARCVMLHYADDARTELLASEEITGSLFQLFDRATAFLTRCCGIDSRLLQEALVLLLLHRDYRIPTASVIRVTPSAVTFFAAGGLLPGMSLSAVAQLMATECRNPKLARLFQSLHLTECYRGFDLIRRHYATTPIESLLAADDSSFTLRLPRNDVLALADTQREKRVLAFVSHRSPVSRSEIQAALGVSQTTAVGVIKAMIEKGLLEKTAEGRSTKYRLKGLD